MRLLILLFLCFLACVNATHWAFGTCVWRVTSGGPGVARTYNFTLNLAFRRSYFNPLPTAPPYGATNGPYAPAGSYPANIGFFACTASTCSAGGTSLTTFGIQMVPQDIIPLGDWFTGKVNFVRTFSQNSILDQNIFWEYWNCCRLSTINDTNNDLNWRVTGVMNRFATDSPSTTSVPRDYEDVGYRVRYSLLASHPAGRNLTYTLAATGCNGGPTGSCLNFGVPTAPYTCQALSAVCIETSGLMTIDLLRGNVSWSPSRLGLFSVQYTITDIGLYPGEPATGSQRTTVPLDMLFEIVPVQPAPYFYQPFPLSVPPEQRIWTFYRGVEGQYPVCARSNATGAIIDINQINLPPGATFTFVNSGRDALGAFTCFVVKWAPRIDSVPTTACYLAKDTVNGYTSRGSYCILMIIGDAKCIYITGIIRDFHIVHADFSLPKPPAATPPTFTLDNGVPFLDNVLPADRKPTLRITGVTYTSTRNSGIYSTATVNPIKSATTPTAEGYYDWWFTDTRALPDAQLRNKQRVETTILCNAGTPSEDIFRFLSSSYYPIDNQLFGNEGDPHNRYFTYEVNTYLTYIPGHVYTLKSSDDLWVFVEGLLPTNPGGGAANGPNGWSLSGIRADFNSAQSTINMDLFKSVQKTDLTANETYRCDIFYAHRNRIGDPGLQIDLPDFSLCNGLTSGVTAFNFTSFDLGNRANMVLQGAAAWPSSGNYLKLIDATQTSQSSAAWYGNNGVPAKIKALYGFRTTFSFQFMSPAAEGFAFVLMGGTTAPTPGTQGPNLGYASLARTIAFEFDSSYSSFLGDLQRNGTGWTGQYSEVSIHARFKDTNGLYPANDAYESHSFGYSLNDPWMNFNNQTVHTIVIEYVTGKLDPNGAPSPSLLRVFMNSVLSPVCQGVVNAADVSDMFQTGAVWAGFTAANSAAIAGTIGILRWDMKIVPISPSKTAPVTPPGSPANIIAGDNSIFRIQTKDDCGNNILVGGEASSFLATYTDPLCPGVPVFNSTPIADYNDGTYGLPYGPTRAAGYQFDVKFQGIPIANNPFSYVVSPAATDPPSCPIIFGELIAGYSVTTLPDGLVVATFDQYGKLKIAPRVYDFTTTPTRALYTGGPSQFATFMTTASNFATGDYVVVALDGVVTISTTYATLPAVVSAMSGMGASLWPPTATQAYAFIGRYGMAKCAESKALGQTNTSCRGSDNRSQSGPRPFTVTSESLLTPCGGAAGGYARINSVFDIPRVPAGTENIFSVMANDRFYNLKTQQADNFFATFIPDFTQDALPGGGTVVSGNDPSITFDRGFYQLRMLSRRSNTFQLYIELNDVYATGGSQYGMFVIVTPGPAFVNTSNSVGGVDITGNGVTTATAGVAANFFVNLKDRNGNSILSDEPVDVITGQLIYQDGSIPVPPIPITFTWVNDTANNCAYCKFQATYNTTKASVPNVIQYRIQLNINGDIGYFGDPNVVAGPIFYPLCTHDCNTTQGLPAGSPVSCTITTRDRFNNVRYVPNSPDPDFTFTNGTTPPSVSFNPPLNILSASVNYPGGGLYRITYAPKTKGALSLSIQGPTGTHIAGSPTPLTVIPGIPDKKSIMNIGPATFNVTAGTWYSFTMTSIDPYDNVRDGGVAQNSDYVLRFAGTVLDGQIRIASTSAHASNGMYTFEVMQTTPTGLYQVLVRTKFNDHVVNSPFASINIIPDMTYPDNTIVSGTGIFACIANQPAYITLQARDIYNNTQLAQEDALKFHVNTRYPNGTGALTVGSVTPLGSGRYNLTYQCPALTGNPYMDVILTHDGNPTHNPPYQNKTWIYPVLILANSATAYSQLLNSSDQRAGIINQPFIIQDCDNAACTIAPTSPCQTSPCFRITLTNGAGETVPPDAFVVTLVTLTPLPLYAVTFISPYIGQFRIRVFRNGIVETEDSKTGTLPVYTINIGPGYVSSVRSSIVGAPATVLAGSSNTITVALRDTYGYDIPTTQTVSAIFSGPSTYGPVSCTQQSVNSPNYNCPFNLTTAGSWTVQLSSTGVPPPQPTGTIRGTAPSDLFDITVQPLGPSCATSSITFASTPITAGAVTSPGTLQLNLKDMYGNTPNINGFNGLSFDITSNTPADMALGFTSTLVSSSGTGGALYSVQYSPTKRNPAGGPNTVTAYISGCPFGTAAVTINPGAPAVPPSNIVRGGPTVAGAPITFTLNLMDRYGNPWLDAPSRVSVTYSGNIPLNVVSAGSPGSYTVTLSGQNTQRAWEPDYAFAVAVDGNPLDFTNDDGFQVVAGPTDPLRTTMIGVRPQPVAMVTTYQITTADQYGNTRRQNSQPAPGSDVISFFFMDGSLPCTDESLSSGLPPLDPAEYTINVGSTGTPAVHDGNGTYHITWSGRKTGTFQFNVTVNGSPILCDNDEVQVLTPDVAYPGTSYWVIPTTNYPDVPAGQQFPITVTLRDRFGNKIETLGASDVIFGNENTGGANFSLADTGFNQTPTSWMTAGTGNAGFPTQVTGSADLRINSEYSFLITCFTASPLTPPPGRTPVAVFLMYQGTYYILKGHVGSGTGSPVIDLRILPGPAATFILPPIAATAAFPHNSFTLQAADKYGNIVDTNLHSYSIIITRTTGIGSHNSEQINYQITPLAEQGTVPGQNVVPFIPYWHGEFKINITMNLNDGTGASYNPGVRYFNISHATCKYEQPTSNYRCGADRTCVGSYSSCPPFNGDTAASCSGTNVKCAANGNCVASAGLCPCPSGETRCTSAGGHCAPICPTPPAVCPSTFPTKCSTGYCRKSPADCPSPHVCSPGFLMCSDGLTCARSAAECGAPIVCAAGLVKCPTGSCVNEFSDCPTLKTCSGSKVVCPDGSCQTGREQCPDVYECVNAVNTTSVRCPDGSCRRTLGECATPVTCPNGYVFCESEVCASQVSDCPLPTLCPLNQTRCPDGSCRHNMLFCPSVSTCPVGVSVTTYTEVNGNMVPVVEIVNLPVKCPDGSCKGSAQQCPAPPICPYYRCSDGSCVECPSGATSCPDRCPTPIACALDKPLLCLDGSCVAVLSDCSPPTQCPSEAPTRCPDNSCRTNLLDCPSHPVCPTDVPVLCPDGQCGASLDTCSPTQLCPPNLIYKCPGGFCAAGPTLCPTLVTCSEDANGDPTIKCLDGTCRTTCAGADSTVPSCSPYLTCPQAGAGLTCASSLEECPQAFSCPTGSVRCLDSSCRTTISLCPPAPDADLYPDGSKVPCSDGTWAADWDQCPTPSTCTSTSPYKCWDGTCRIAPADCPTASGCTSDQYQCPNGACTTQPWDNCASIGLTCHTDAPVKCLTDGLCYPDISYCTDPYTEGCATGSSVTCTTCPGTLCKDGSCRQDPVSCPVPTCPLITPFLCDNGYCAEDSTKCLANNGCPWYAQTRCPTDGRCVNQTSACTSTLTCPPQNPVLDPSAQPPSGFATWAAYFATLTSTCDDGSCASSLAQCYGSNGCPSNTVRCADGSCVDSFDECKSGSSTANACPSLSPYRCSDGFCATSSTQCPNPIVTVICPPERPIQCASGDCVLTATQCPLIVPCLTTEQRCGDGTCKPIGHCPLVNTCPTGAIRCFSGICTSQTIGCNLVNGCPVPQVRCDNGQCVDNRTLCTSLPPNGCSIPGVPTPYKCSDGSCVADQSQCLLPNGCNSTTPQRCPADGSCIGASATCPANPPPGCYTCADGRCVATASLCPALNNCPIGTPYRCADGSCKKFPAGTGNNNPEACSTAVVCGPNQVLCADGACQSSAALCSPVPACPSGQEICNKDWQCHTPAECQSPSVKPQCPPTSPVQCPNGACKGSIEQCGFSGGGPSPSPCIGGYICQDGSCKNTIQACMNQRNSVTSPGATFPPTSSVNALCPSNYTLCWDGSCVSACWRCDPIPRCPKGQTRCLNGDCDTFQNCVTKNQATPACATGLVRCEDGMCRESCCGYDGCGHDSPFHCTNRECAKKETDCDKIAKGTTTYYHRRLLQTTPQFDATVPCFDNCYSEVKASTQSVTVSYTRASVITLAVNSALTPIMRLSIPQGALVPRNGTGTTTVLDIRTVAESRLRSAFNAVHPTRVNAPPYFYIRYLTFPQTVVSPAFECNVDPIIKEPFNVNLTVTSLVDNVRRDNTDSWVEDICLASLLEIGQYKNWVCQFSSQYDRRLTCPPPSAAPGCLKGKYVVRDPATAPPPENLVSSVINRCTQAGGTTGTTRVGSVYAFITAPLSVYFPPKTKGDDIVESNIVPIVLGIIFIILFVIFLIYMAVRLLRYRQKYHDEKAEADRLKEEVDNMSQFNTAGATVDPQVQMTDNPLAAKMKYLEQAVNQEDLKIQQAEVGLGQQEAEIRKDHLRNMQANRDKMAAELEKLKAELASASASTAAPSTMEEPRGAQPTYEGGGSGEAYRTEFDQYQAPRGGPKRRDQ